MMNEKSRPCCAWRRQAGLTLVEVVAGLLLMSTLLVGILQACVRHVRQTKLAQQRQAAVALADKLLTQWHRNPQGLPENERGEPDDSGLNWRTQPVENAYVAEAMNLRIVQLEILDVKSVAGQEPLVVVEVAKPLPRTKTHRNAL